MVFKLGHNLNLGNKYALGNKHSEEWKAKAKQRMLGNTNGFVKGKPSPRKGKKSNVPAWNKGLKMPNRSGENAWNWVSDRNSIMEKKRLRGTVEWRNWRNTVFRRDNHSCQECGRSGVALEPHHIIPLRTSTLDAFKVENGITLCVPCHKKTIRKEEDFEEKYTNIIKSKLSRK